jgi:hypothetical protein
MAAPWVRTIARALLQVDWTSRPMQQAVVSFVQGLTGQDPDQVAARRAEQQAAAWEALAARLTPAPPPDTGPPMAAAGPVSLQPAIEQVTLVTGDLKEALRFAREDGMTHPETIRRVAHAQALVDTLERFTLRPETLAALPPSQRQVVERQVLPTLRRARQALHNAPDGSPPTVASLSDAAAQLGTVATQLRVTQAATGAPPGPALDLGQVPPPPAPAAAAPSQYAPEAAVDTGCLPCGRAHLGAASGTLEAAARLAASRGMADPETQAALQTAAEELAMVQLYDWTPERIARSPAADRTLLERYAPQVERLRQAVEQARTPAEVAAVADQAQRLRTAFVQDDLQRAPTGQPGAAYITEAPPTDPTSHRVTPPPWWYHPPTPVTLGETTVPTDTARAFDDLTRALAARGVKVRVRNLPATPEGVVEGEYLFDQNTILLGPAALAKDAYAVQVLAHEAAHALEDNPTCHTYNAAVPYEERTEEQLAQYASIIALTEAGLPVELATGAEVPPGTRQIDWDLLRAELPPEDFSRLLWTSAWITDALTGAPRDYGAETCPPLTLTTFPRAGT